MKAIVPIIALSLVLVFSVGVGAQQNKYLENQAQCLKLSADFLSILTTGQIERAFSNIRPYFYIPDKEIEELTSNTKGQLEATRERFGDMLGYQLIRDQEVADTVAKYTFIVRHEFTATRWFFTFYKPEEEKWLLNSLSWDDMVEEIFN